MKKATKGNFYEVTWVLKEAGKDKGITVIDKVVAVESQDAQYKLRGKVIESTQKNGRFNKGAPVGETFNFSDSNDIQIKEITDESELKRLKSRLLVMDL